jgi:GTPase SAR1 family protein
MDYSFKKNYHEETIKLPKFRIIVLGCGGVGKTSIVSQFVNNSFKETYDKTKEIK